MPRTPDPDLEDRIVAAALRLLDGGGEEAVTMRAVALAAGTTTPTIYERFPDREALLRQVARRGTDEVLSAIQSSTTVESIASEFLRFSCAHPLRFNLTVETFSARFAAGEPRPAFDLLKSRLTKEVGVTAARREDLALAIVSLFIGTARGMVAVGCESRHAGELRRAALSALRLLLRAFSDNSRTRARSG